jgi:serine/threonine protein kinase/tetratricopeptide (TPR) repeat protein
MDVKHFQRVEELYRAALVCESKERSALLDHADPGVRREVELMLAQQDSALDRPAWDSAASLLETQTIVTSGSRLGPYQIQHLLGAGGMGEVYQAMDTRLGRTVAVKVLPRQVAGNPALKRRFLREARAASALNHPNIVGLYDISSHEGADFLVMEYVAGKTLKELIPPGGLTLDGVAGLGSQIALALGAAHAAGIVHRDLKPANILVTPQQQVKVVDFGIAKLPHDRTVNDLTQDGQIVGTVSYMSPEQTRGEHVDAGSDIFSLGCVLYEAATGQLPFTGPSALAVMNAIATSDAAPPGSMRPDLPPEFDRLVARCLLKDAARRPESAIELATELKSLTLPASVLPRVRTERPSLAVIPFQLRGPDADQYLSVSLADAMIHRLSSSGRLIVRPIGSVMRYAGKETEWAKVARELNVDLIVEGVIQTMGPKVRVLLQAHRASDAETLAAIKQDGDTGDLFGLQDRICDAVSDVFIPRDKGKDKPLPATRHPGAYELYLRAVDRQVHVDKYDMASAIEMLTRATELDPGFADAWGLLAQACAQMGGHLDPDPKWFDLGEQAIARALELDPVQCDALCARGIVSFSSSRRFQNRAALRALNAALKINPLRQTARHQRSAVLWHLGFLDAATEDAEELQLANPALSMPGGHLAQIAVQRGEFQQAIDYNARALSLDPNQVLIHLFTPVPLLWSGRLAEARQELDNARQILPNETFITGMDAIFAALDGNFVRAEALADAAAHSGKSLTHTHHTWHYCAGAYALSGKPEKAIAELQRCGDLGLPSYRLFEIDPYLRSLRMNPAFRELMTALRREHDSIRDEFGLEAEAGQD